MPSERVLHPLVQGGDQGQPSIDIHQEEAFPPVPSSSFSSTIPTRRDKTHIALYRPVSSPKPARTVPSRRECIIIMIHRPFPPREKIVTVPSRSVVKWPIELSFTVPSRPVDKLCIRCPVPSRPANVSCLHFTVPFSFFFPVQQVKTVPSRPVTVLSQCDMPGYY